MPLHTSFTPKGKFPRYCFLQHSKFHSSQWTRQHLLQTNFVSLGTSPLSSQHLCVPTTPSFHSGLYKPTIHSFLPWRTLQCSPFVARSMSCITCSTRQSSTSSNSATWEGLGASSNLDLSPLWTSWTGDGCGPAIAALHGTFRWPPAPRPSYWAMTHSSKGVKVGICASPRTNTTSP